MLKNENVVNKTNVQRKGRNLLYVYWKPNKGPPKPHFKSIRTFQYEPPMPRCSALGKVSVVKGAQPRTVRYCPAAKKEKAVNYAAFKGFRGEPQGINIIE
jgi:hypothetical protein